MASGGKESEVRQRGNTPRNNQAQNRQTDSAANKLKLTKSQREELHRRVGHEGMGYDDIWAEAMDIKDRRKGEKPWKQKRGK